MHDERTPPGILRSMRNVSAGGRPENAEEEWLAGLQAKNPLQFLREFRAAEREFAATAPQTASLGNSSSGEALVDEGEERVLELLRKLLGEYGGRT